MTRSSPAPLPAAPARRDRPVFESDLDGVLADDLQVSVMRLARRLRSVRGDHRLTLTQLSLLSALQRHGPLTPGEIAEHEQVRPPSVTRTLAALDELHLITRAPHPDDRRQHLIELTPAAADLISADRRRRQVWLAEQVDRLGPADRAALAAAVSVLDRLADPT